MAKGDDSRSRNRIDQQSGLSQNYLNNLRTDTIVPQNQYMWNRYQDSVDQAKQDYGQISSGYQNFAKTGGFGPMDLASIRARAIAPTRAVYANARREVDRTKALQGGYSPGHGTLMARMAREQSQGLSDASMNAEAGIAQMVQAGKLAGLGGQSSLYGTTPGMANMFGNQVLRSTDQQLALAGLQNQLSLGTMDAQINASRLPGKMDSTIDQVGGWADIGAGGAGAIYPWMNPPKG